MPYNVSERETHTVRFIKRGHKLTNDRNEYLFDWIKIYPNLVNEFENIKKKKKSWLCAVYEIVYSIIELLLWSGKTVFVFNIFI